MNFLAPGAFWFLAALPVVIVFYLLKRKRVVRVISSTLLWQRFLSETQASAPFQKLRHNWLLILQLLLLLFVILALSRPYFSGRSASRSLRVLVLDASASMQSTDEAPSRFAKAKAEALKWVDALRDNDQMIVLLAGPSTEVKQSPTSNKAALRRAIESCEATDARGDLNDALKLAETLVRDQPASEVHLFSDGAVPDLSSLENKGLPLVFHPVGTRGNNLAIVNLDVKANPENPEQRAIYVGVANFSTNRQEVEVDLVFEKQVVDSRVLAVEPGATAPHVFVAPQTRDGIFTVRLVANDDLAADNEASAVSMLPKPLRVLLVTRGNNFLERALSSVAKARVTTAAEWSPSLGEFDVVVLDDAAVTTLPKENLLALHVASTNWFESWAKLENPMIIDWKGAHPLLRYVNLDNVLIRESLAVKTPPWAVSLVESQTSPLVLAGETRRQKVVWVGFDVTESNWPLKVSFPIFIANALDWLDPSLAGAADRMIPAGGTIRMPAPDGAVEAKILTPAGTSRSVPINTNRHEIAFSETLKQGVYRVEAGTNQTWFCVNLLDASESRAQPRRELNFGKYGLVKASTTQRANLEMWRWIAAVGLAVLLFEWWFYHRRTA
jgi:Ca-activated chloride channel family protein